MSTHHARSFAIRSFLTVLSSLSVLACQPVQFACPEGFVLSPEGRCLGVDAGALPPGDGGPVPATDAGVDAAPAVDAGSVIDAAIELPDAWIAATDAAVEPPDAYVEPPDAYVAPDACAWGTWYADRDGDGFGDRSAPVSACAQPAGTVTDAIDCDDTRSAVHPGATEVCNGIDDNCNGSVDEGVVPTFYYDADGDGHGDLSMPVTTYCTAPPHFVSSSDDCDDHDATSYPGATEVCDARDDDCDGTIDEGVKLTFYVDVDHDGYGGTATMLACSAPTGYVATSGDCDDVHATIHPGATETCDFVDQNCNGVIDDGLQISYFVDCDGDHYAPTGAVATPGCPTIPPPSAPPCATGGTWTSRAPTSSSSTDCADAQPLAHPGSTHFDASPAYYVGTTPRWDWNCDGVDTQRVATTTGTLTCAPPSGLSLACQVSGEHWYSFVPRCGVYNNLYTCSPATATPACSPSTPWTQQTCN